MFNFKNQKSVLGKPGFVFFWNLKNKKPKKLMTLNPIKAQIKKFKLSWSSSHSNSNQYSYSTSRWISWIYKLKMYLFRITSHWLLSSSSRNSLCNRNIKINKDLSNNQCRINSPRNNPPQPNNKAAAIKNQITRINPTIIRKMI